MPETCQPTNRLIHETSPYLLQHAHNPVDWYPWGEEAFQKAKEEDKPILLSCGYSACHWCHVMERESFEDEEIAGLMNRYFVNIKVDREERPDIDQLYQQAVHVMSEQGGWPLTVFLDHDRRPFFGGTYFPPTPMYGRMSFPQLLEGVYRRWVEKRELIHEAGREMLEYLKPDPQAVPNTPVMLKQDFPMKALGELNLYTDQRNGGFGRAPKFPNPILLDMFLRTGTAYHHQSSINHVLFTLKQMARGGIYDQLGGGFHRYSTDEHWLVPHFEKMLYDNAQLIQSYAMAYQISGEAEFKTVVEETVNYLQREMLTPEGGFYATQDADSEGEEGKYFVWEEAEIRSILSKDDDDVFLKYYGITADGNFEGKNILNRLETADQEQSPAEREQLETAREKLFHIRDERIKPFRDEKVICGWNGLIIGALAYASQVFQNDRYYRMANSGMEFIRRFMHLGNGGLARIYKNGKAGVAAFLEDYAFVVRALLELYETDFDPSRLELGLELTQTAIQRFSDGTGVYYVSAASDELITRPVSGEDQAIPSGVAVHVDNLLRLHAFSGQKELREEAQRILAVYSEAIEADLWSHIGIVRALDAYYQGFKEFTFITRDVAIPEILKKLREQFIPYRILVWSQEAGAGLSGHPAHELLQDRKAIDGKATCYACENFNCLPPATEWETIKNLL